MLQLDSKEYKYIKVTLRDSSIIMPLSSGVKLMEYLTGDNTSSHVMITDKAGGVQVVNKNDIRKVSPVKEDMSSYKTPDELGLAESVDRAEGDGYEMFRAIRRKANKSL